VPRSRQQLEPPEFFIDRSLGRHQVPNALRSSGYTVHTMLSVYGPEAEQKVEDTVWLKEAGRNGWLVLTKDERIRRRPLELEAIDRHGVRVACLTNRHLTGEQQVHRIMTNIHRIVQRARKPGPWVVAKDWRLGAAGHAPRGPEVEHHRLAPPGALCRLPHGAPGGARRRIAAASRSSSQA
jgi:hypothetical protein